MSLDLFKLMRRPMKNNLSLTEKQSPAPTLPAPAPTPPLLVAGPTVGFRLWRVVGDRLHSTAQGSPWLPGEPISAYCTAFMTHAFPGFDGSAPLDLPHRAPHATCTCGIYAMRRLADVPSYKDLSTLVAGSVALWGKVIEQRLGYRGQYAYPIALWPPPFQAVVPPGFPDVRSRWRPMFQEVADTYGVPLLDGPPH